jgi:hypothetical protein
LGILSVIVTVLSALVLVYTFKSSDFWKFFLEALLRVSNVGGTTVLMLALAYSLGAFAQCSIGMIFFARDFGLSYKEFPRLLFESLAASIVGGAGAYGVLVVMGELVDINTLPGIFAQGALGGIVGLAVTALVLSLLKNKEIIEALSSLKRRRTVSAPPVALEPTDVSS